MKFYFPILVLGLIIFSCSDKSDYYQTNSLNNIIISKLKENDGILLRSQQYVREDGNKPRDTMVIYESFKFYNSILNKYDLNNLHESCELVKRYLLDKKIDNLILVSQLNHFDSLSINSKNPIDSLFLKIAILDGLKTLLDENLNEVGGSCRMYPTHAFNIYSEKKYAIGDTIKICIVPGELYTQRIYISKPIEIKLLNVKNGNLEKFDLDYAGNAAFVKFVAKESGTFLLKGSLKYSPLEDRNNYLQNSFEEQIKII